MDQEQILFRQDRDEETPLKQKEIDIIVHHCGIGE